MMNVVLIFLKDLILHYGYWGIFLITTMEQFFLPIPVDVFIGFSIKQGLNYYTVMGLIFIGTFLGACIGYALGKFLGHPAFEWFFGKRKIEKGESFIKKWGIFGVIIAGFLPIVPFQITTWIAGIFEMSFSKFLLGVMIGRIPRYLLTGYLGMKLFETKLGF